MADFASLHEEADALGDNFMTQMMSSGNLDSGHDATSSTMAAYPSSFLPSSSRRDKQEDDASSVSSQLSSRSSSSSKAHSRSSASSSEENDLNRARAETSSEESSSEDSDDDDNEDNNAKGEADHDDELTSASSSTDDLLSSYATPGVTLESSKSAKKHKSKKSENGSNEGKPKPKIRLSLKVGTTKAATISKSATSTKKKAPVAKKPSVKSGKTLPKKEVLTKKEAAVKTKKRKLEDVEDEESTSKKKTVPKPKPKVLKAGSTSSLNGKTGGTATGAMIPPKKRKISTPKSKTTKDTAAAKAPKGKAAAVKNPNKNKGKKGSGAANASNDAGPGTALEITLPPRDSARPKRFPPLFFYSTKPESKSQGADVSKQTNSIQSAHASALAATAYVPDLKVKLPPFQSPGLIVHPSLGFTASSSNTLSAANLHLEKKVAREMFRNALEQSGYIYPPVQAPKKEEKKKKSKSEKSKDTDPIAVVSELEMVHRGSSTTRTIEDLFDRWIPGEEARKLMPKDFYEVIPCHIEDEYQPGTMKTESLSVLQAFQKSLGSYLENLYDEQDESENDVEINGDVYSPLPLHERLPYLPQDYKDMLPITLISPYAEDFTYKAKWANYTSEVNYRELCIAQSQQFAKQKSKKPKHQDSQDPDEVNSSVQEPQVVMIPHVPKPPSPPPLLATKARYQPEPQEHLLKHLDRDMYAPTTSRYHGLLSSAIADPQYVGPNAPGLLGLIHMMSAVGSSANAAAAAALSTGDGTGNNAKKKKKPAPKKKA